VLSQEEIRVVETQEEIPFVARVNPLTKLSSSSWDTMLERRNVSFFGNMAKEEERVDDEGHEDDQTFGFPVLNLEQNVNMKLISILQSYQLFMVC